MLRVSKMTDYSVVILSCFVARDPKCILKATEITDSIHVPLPTVSKILKLLTKGNILLSHRGVQGGYSLARQVEDISVADILCAIDGPVALTACVDDSGEVKPCEAESLCPMRGRWGNINRKVKQVFSSVSLKEIATPVDFIRYEGEVQ